ncbi:MAG: hydrogenase maturation nickel metallochaperone HypA [Bacteroidota bacterium]
MHELSIAMGIVKIAEKEAKKANAKKIELIELEIGELSGVQIDALDFAWPMAVNGTLLESAKKIVFNIKGIAVCSDCKHEYEISHYYDSCPKCNSNLKIIVQGKELRVKSLEVS